MSRVGESPCYAAYRHPTRDKTHYHVSQKGELKSEPTSRSFCSGLRCYAHSEALPSASNTHPNHRKAFIANEAHGQQLQYGGSAWNAWRNAHLDLQPDLTNA